MPAGLAALDSTNVGSGLRLVARPRAGAGQSLHAQPHRAAASNHIEAPCCHTDTALQCPSDPAFASTHCDTPSVTVFDGGPQ